MTIYATPVRSALLCGALANWSASAAAQRPIPVVTIPPSSVRSTESLGAIVGLRQGPGGSVLVNDAARRQLRLLDSTLSNSTIVADSAPGSADSYGPMRNRLIPYFGDSSLFLDVNSQALLVLDARGRVARTVTPPMAQNAGLIYGMIVAGATNTDRKGRLIYRGLLAPDADSVAILRADLDTRTVDTIGRVRVATRGRQAFDNSIPGKLRITVTIDPLPLLDEWVVLSDGTVALVRGYDYHVDWIHPDGSRTASPKLPFDWKRLTDDDKQKAVDSARAANAAVLAALSSGAGAPGAAVGPGEIVVAEAAAAALAEEATLPRRPRRPRSRRTSSH